MTYVAERKGGADGAPLIFTFHGTGGDEHQFHGLASEMRPDAHVVSPRGDVSEMGANRFFRRTGEGVYDMDDLRARVEAMAAFMEAEKQRVGAGQVMALGYSNGANILAAVSFVRPDLVDDIALLHPLIPWSPEEQSGLLGRRVLITAGERDPICPPDATRALEAYYLSQGADLASLWHPGGHEIRHEEIAALQDFFTANLEDA